MAPDGGGSATVGVQVASDRGTQFSFNTPSLNDSSALLWTIPQPAIAVTPTSLNFGNVPVGSSADLDLTVKNAGGDVLMGSASTSAPFSIASGGSYSLPAGQSQTVTVRFSPTAAGAFAGNVTFTSNGGNASSAVTGTGVDHTLTITSGPSGTPNPVASGGTATLSVTAVDSWGHSLSYAWTAACPGLPSNGSFSNASAQAPTWTAPANTTGSQQDCTIQVTVSDGQGLSQTGSYSQGVSSVPHTLTITSGPSGTPNPVGSWATATLSVTAVDSLKHSLSYAWTAACPALGSNGSFSSASVQNPTWTAPANTTGSQQDCTIQVTVSDGQGLSATGSYSQGVNPAQGCPATAALEGSSRQAAKLTMLYAFRDKVLAATPAGQRYTQLFYKHGTEGVWLMVRHPELRARSRALLERFLPTLQAMLTGKKAVMTAADLAAMDALLEAFRAKASPQLQADLKGVQGELRQGTVLKEFGIGLQDQGPISRR
ncbi:MAG: choice-of-anchor D domain-containing protein [Candidatus Rokubacteria bacterium]|nr:choice-of-anchor D domain-containing protein [Candidatus Rokubacteria bacterium]